MDDVLKKCMKTKKDVSKEKHDFIITTNRENSHVSKTNNSRRSWTPLKSQRDAINDLVKPMRQQRRNQPQMDTTQKSRMVKKSVE